MRWIIGMIINFFGSISINFGTNIIQSSFEMKKSNDDGSLRERRALWFWKFGYFLFIIGNLLNFISLSYSPQTLLSGFSNSMQIFSNIIYNRFIKFKIMGTSNNLQHLSINLISGTVLIIAGCILIIIFSTHTVDIYTIQEMEDLYKNNAYIIFISIQVFFIIIFFIIYRFTRNSNNSLPFTDELFKELTSGIVQNPVLTQRPVHENNELPSILGSEAIRDLGSKATRDSSYISSTSYIMISCMIGTHTLILAKSGSELFYLTVVEGNNQFRYTFTYIIIVMWVILTVFWIFNMNRILKKYNDQYIIPTLQSMWTLLSIVSGGIYFQEFRDFSIFRYFIFFLGTFMTILGILFIKSINTDNNNVNNLKSPSNQELI